MPIDTLPPVPETALVLIDLQHGITSLPTIHPANEIVARAGPPRRHVPLPRLARLADGEAIIAARSG
jgi:hypothetical protein